MCVCVAPYLLAYCLFSHIQCTRALVPKIPKNKKHFLFLTLAAVEIWVFSEAATVLDFVECYCVHSSSCSSGFQVKVDRLVSFLHLKNHEQFVLCVVCIQIMCSEHMCWGWWWKMALWLNSKFCRFVKKTKANCTQSIWIGNRNRSFFSHIKSITCSVFIDFLLTIFFCIQLNNNKRCRSGKNYRKCWMKKKISRKKLFEFHKQVRFILNKF